MNQNVNEPSSHRRLHPAGLLSALLAMLLLSACAAAPKDDSQQVIERAQQRWDAIIANDLEQAYEYYSPGYRSSTPMIDFAVEQRVRRVVYTSAEYVGHQCEASRCSVTFKVGYRVYAPVPGLKKYDGAQGIEDTWVKTSGEWWYLPNK